MCGRNFECEKGVFGGPPGSERVAGLWPEPGGEKGGHSQEEQKGAQSAQSAQRRGSTHKRRTKCTNLEFVRFVRRLCRKPRNCSLCAPFVQKTSKLFALCALCAFLVPSWLEGGGVSKNKPNRPSGSRADLQGRIESSTTHGGELQGCRLQAVAGGGTHHQRHGPPNKVSVAILAQDQRLCLRFCASALLRMR